MTAPLNKAFDADVLVVGLGPTGDVLAALLAQAGLSVVGIDREGDIYGAPRAAVFDHEIMRIFQSLDLAEQILDACRVPDRYEFVTAGGETLLDFELSPQTEVSGWAENYLLHQPAVERALRNRLAPLGVDVRLSTRLVDLSDDGQGVVSRLSGPDGETSLRTRWVVGSDGASSIVRDRIGVSLFDYQFDEPWLVIDAVTDEAGDLPQRLLQICDPKRPVTYLKMCANRYRWEFMIKPGENPAQIASDASLKTLLAPWNCYDRLTIERRAVYRFHGLVAQQWRRGRVILAGDAAHQMPPFAGQGMCAGIRDAANLAWKIAAVAHGLADESLLDTFQAEREGHVRAVIETAIAMGQVVCLLDEQAAAGRDAQMLARKAAGERDIALSFPDLRGGLFNDLPGSGALFPQAVSGAVRLDDVLGQGAWLIGRNTKTQTTPGIRVISLDDPRLAPFAEPIGAWLDKHRASSVLVRPDRHVFGAGETADLLNLWQAGLATDKAVPAETALHVQA
jgi:3-(3-hydroxy-phenyl)propionate hydroxylase